MLKAGFFARFGLFVLERFLDESSCARLRREMQSSSLSPASVGHGAGEVIDEDARAAKWARVSAESRSWVRQRLLELKPRLEYHFGMALKDCQAPQFLVYRVGGFYVAHSDVAEEFNEPKRSHERRVSVVLFLNGQSEEGEPESYRGGALTFSGLIDDPRLQPYVYPLLGETGLLIAFRSNVIHGVTPVVGGERFTIASWFV